MVAVVSRLKNSYSKSKFWNSRIPECLSVVFFVVLYCVVSAYHEPWFDEVQSWQIAKCEGIGRILFHIPHYEGNPPLWYLILAIPAKFGVPFELGLKAVGFIICICSVLLIEIKSPFPRPVKLILPLTYFFFYQYGIIVRPYGLMILAFILVSIFFKERNEKPWKFILCLAFLCETSSFCVVIAGGIAACWAFEIVRERIPLQRLFKDVRVYSLLALLAFAVLLIATLIPAADASFTTIWERKNSLLECFLLGVTTFLSETLMITSPWFSNDQTALAEANVQIEALIPCIIVQLIIFVLIISFSNKRNLKYFIIPYLCFCLFGALVFLGGHHLGIGCCVLFFWLWVSCADNQQFEIGKRIADRLKLRSKDTSLLKAFAIAFCGLSIIMSLTWTVTSSWKEIIYQYSYGRETARYLEETGLINARIAMSWPEGTTESDEPDYEKMDTKSNGWPVPLCAYAGRNVVYNFNDGADDAAYVQFIKQNAEQNRNSIERWKQDGAPEVLLGQVDVELLTDRALSIKDYSPVYEMEINYIWKGNLYKSMQYIFVRNDLLEKYSLTPIERPDGLFGNISIQITDEIRERYENGEDIDDILKTYLDYIFGKESGK